MPLATDISNAERSSIVDTMNQIKHNHLLNDRWIDEKNRYRKDTLNILKTDSRSRINQKHLREYIASSSILFCCDGWINFSRSIEGLLNGDIASSIHLAYYAEIKAVMSLLASEGVGVFQNDHYYVNNTKQVLPISDRSQTHKFIPKAIIEWAKLPKSESLFKQLVYNNFSFSRWFDASPYRVMAVSQRIATSWFDEYSLDLNYIERDHILRNEMSYRPQGFAIDFNNNAFQTTLSFVKDLWKISEPDSSNAFSILDRHLLRLGIEKLYHSQTTPLRKLDSSVYTKFVMDIFDNLGISTSNHLFQFIIRRVEPNDLDLFSYAKQGPYRKRINSNNNPSYYRKNQYYSLNDVFGILSRTFILMRFSLSMANGLLNNSTITKNDIGFWLNNLGRNFGISNNLSNTTNLTDLYTSVKDSMESIETIDTIVASPTLLDAHNNSVSDEFKFLIQFQRAFFWGITN